MTHLHVTPPPPHPDSTKKGLMLTKGLYHFNTLFEEIHHCLPTFKNHISIILSLHYSPKPISFGALHTYNLSIQLYGGCFGEHAMVGSWNLKNLQSNEEEHTLNHSITPLVSDLPWLAHLVGHPCQAFCWLTALIEVKCLLRQLLHSHGSPYACYYLPRALQVYLLYSSPINKSASHDKYCYTPMFECWDLSEDNPGSVARVLWLGKRA